ncbi:acyl-CoA carboxylase subunit beta [Leptospira borgpetersenii]|uniref:Acetyl-CoA carboxylase, carboxyltransferase component (Subunits alpha and beta) n=2 Tax=Leptospira borgpetersenii serovar Hardjo-bovis TaxID=338217 RepID=Q04RW8_LEPBJ|nr:carboxyl transferase domain-containing protein [Leptospira borgpetersenii]ABJ76352.1 Acetyl-CoA carboxylase, carboxyltransferase component (subunits alpha and beta) [Leptospira borgpetersenii serovar Hardjo-bovis str. JB197]ABJ78942.1 Acetyl-CoA carboxylase, carboxyltransferase component (subunits alpha and beta) [Leptospira borgpetersenii serovar Hardjo-bovis str. L550]AMX58224.1 acetyl-CoA carboxylase [Leptospira borgpetersenii serovar Hardjo]AMX61476.1 acetyl-CoA carboxylase [Leptospira b
MSEAKYSLENPFQSTTEPNVLKTRGLYEEANELGKELLNKPLVGGGVDRILVQHSKERMTVWERIKVLTEKEPNILYQNWGKSLDGASLVTGILNINGRDVAIYGHDFTLRAGSMDATNGSKLARLIYMAGEHGIPLIGMNDSAGAYVPAGVGGLDGYSEAFTALRKISGVVPSLMLMFGFNAGGGAYLPRQGSFMIQCDNTFFGLTGPGVVKSVLGEDISADDLGGPKVHGQSGVVDIVTGDELGSLRTALRLLSYLPDNNHSFAPFHATSDPTNRFIYEEEILFKKTFNSPTGMNTPFDITLYLQNICDHGQYFEIQGQRSRNLVTAFGRIGGHVIAFVANNSAVSSGQIDIGAARKGTRFIRFCNLYNIPIVFLEDTTGFLPGKEQEQNGIVLEGRKLLDSIIDIRTPRLTLIIRNAFGGAYACFNSYHTGADMVFALPTARIAVMGPAGKDYVYKDEVSSIQKEYQENVKKGMSEKEAVVIRDKKLQTLSTQYERELMNPKEALSLGSVSRIVLPGTTRNILFQNLDYLIRHYKPAPLSGPQREFE